MFPYYFLMSMITYSLDDCKANEDIFERLDLNPAMNKIIN